MIHDIPGYDLLFIEDGGVVFLTNKHTGEIVSKLTISESCALWRQERATNEAFIKHYTAGYQQPPKAHPDTARDLKTLKSLCSDRTRHSQGDDGYLLDFMGKRALTVELLRMFQTICKRSEVWNYSLLTAQDLAEDSARSLKQVRRDLAILEVLGMIRTLTHRFETPTGWKDLVKIHPKLFWKGRHSAWLAAAALSYEYMDEEMLQGI